MNDESPLYWKGLVMIQTEAVIEAAHKLFMAGKNLADMRRFYGEMQNFANEYGALQLRKTHLADAIKESGGFSTRC